MKRKGTKASHMIIVFPLVSLLYILVYEVNMYESKAETRYLDIKKYQ